MAAELSFESQPAGTRRVARVDIAPQRARSSCERIFFAVEQHRAMRLGIDSGKSKTCDLRAGLLAQGITEFFAYELGHAVRILRPQRMIFIDREISRLQLGGGIVKPIHGQARSADDF